MPKLFEREVVENKWKKFWEEKNIFQFDEESQKPLYIVDTPPPYVSADHLHAGHLMSYAQAEFVVRYKRMRGFNVYYPMGFDDNGLPTERFVEKKYNVDKTKVTRSEFIDLCLKETEIGSKTYRQLWQDLGISVDWTKVYSTIGSVARKVSQWSLIDLHKKDALYRKEDPILWCTTCRTALSQSDLEDKEDDSKMNFINFTAENGNKLLIATSRPEMLPACVALYVNPSDKRYADLVGKDVTVPISGHKVTVKTSEKVDIEFGTGLMMVCTWGDLEDLEKWRADNLQTRVIIGEDGLLTELGGKYQGLTLNEARKKIIDDLKETGDLVRQEDITHVLQVHERCSTPVELVMSKQWFIRIKDKKDVWLESGRNLHWFPENRRHDYEMWVESLKWDWCISRQRYYGVPLPVWYCEKCSEPVFAPEEMLPVNPMEVDCPIEQCEKCGSKEFVPEADVMDTWATSSCTPLIIKELVKNPEIKEKLYPASVRPNAFEIIRTWDFYTVVKSYYNFGKLPFSDVMISGHGMDEKGKKFSKRLGNYVPASQLVQEHGADAIRYWATGARLGQNLRYNQQEVEKGKKTANKLWNVARFLQVSGVNNDCVVTDNLKFEEADLWIVSEFNKVLKEVENNFDSYAYSKSRDLIDEFFWSKWADNYLEFVKYRIFGDNNDSKAAASYVLYKVFLGILKMYAPIIPFITEELYSNLYSEFENKISIHLSEWPKEIILISEKNIDDFGEALMAIEEVRKYKSQSGISLGKVLPEYKLETKLNKEKYGDFVAKVVRIENLI